MVVASDAPFLLLCSHLFLRCFFRYHKLNFPNEVNQLPAECVRDDAPPSRLSPLPSVTITTRQTTAVARGVLSPRAAPRPSPSAETTAKRPRSGCALGQNWRLGCPPRFGGASPNGRSRSASDDDDSDGDGEPRPGIGYYGSSGESESESDRDRGANDAHRGSRAQRDGRRTDRIMTPSSREAAAALDSDDVIEVAAIANLLADIGQGRKQRRAPPEPQPQAQGTPPAPQEEETGYAPSSPPQPELTSLSLPALAAAAAVASIASAVRVHEARRSASGSTAAPSSEEDEPPARASSSADERSWSRRRGAESAVGSPPAQRGSLPRAAFCTRFGEDAPAGSRVPPPRLCLGLSAVPGYAPSGSYLREG